MKHRYIALLTAVLLLTGCTGNTPSNSSATSEAPQLPTAEAAAQTVESQSPAGESQPESSAAAFGTAEVSVPAETAPDGGVVLVSGGSSQYGDIFELNGTWCDVNDLPFNMDTYDVPMLVKDGYNFLSCYDKKLYITEGSEYYAGWWSENRLWRCDPATGTEELLYDYSGDASSQTVLFANDKYVAYERNVFNFRDDGTIKDSTEWLTVVNYQTGETVFDVPEKSGNINYMPYRGVQIVFDMMYVSGEYTMPDFGKKLNVVLTVELNSLKVDLYDLGLTSVSYGVGNVCFQTEDYSVRSIYGDVERPLPFSENIGDDSYIWYNMFDTYYPTTMLTNNYGVLGDRAELGWLERSTIEKHTIGKSAFSVHVSSGSVMNRDKIFCANLWKYLTTRTLIEEPDYYEPDINNWLLIGLYDASSESAYAALIDYEKGSFPQITTNNDCIYLIDRISGKVTLIYKEG